MLFVAMRSCHEWEPEAFSLAVKLLGRPVIPLGLLLPSPDMHRDVDVDTTAVHWLDAQPPKSVVYVALGSEVPLHLELAHGLVANARSIFVANAMKIQQTVADKELHERYIDGQFLFSITWRCVLTAQHAHAKKMRAKEGNLFKSSFFGVGVVVSVKHIYSAPKGESSSTVELQIGGVAATELV
jgi:hypothetical protein